MSNMKQKDIRPAPAEIEFKGFKFLITDRPTDLTIPNYILVSIWRSSLFLEFDHGMFKKKEYVVTGHGIPY